MKTCRKCNKIKCISEFGKDKRNLDGIKSYCFQCEKENTYKWKKSKKGLLSGIYANQKIGSVKRNYPPPSYTKAELIEWTFSQKIFHEIYDDWKKSGYDKLLTPSCDRINDYLPYMLSNLQIMTWHENWAKANIDVRGGINNKQAKMVVGIHIETGERIEAYSVSQASRITGVNASNISSCCLGKINYAGKYYWKHNNNN